MQLSECIQSAESHQFRIVFQNVLNDNSNLFGGFTMQWMDEVAYITAIRFTRMKVVTVSVNNLKFKKAIKAGEMVEIIGRVIKVSRMKIEIQVELFVEKSDSDHREKAIEATFTFAAVNNENKPVAIEWEKARTLEKKCDSIRSDEREKSMVY
jgi:acyl-CoA hydrolase